MDFLEDLWATLIAPFIVLILSPIAIAIGNKIFKKWSWKAVLHMIIDFFLVLILFLTIIALRYNLIPRGWNSLLQCIKYVSPLNLSLSTWIFYGFVAIFILLGLAAYFFKKSGGDIGIFQEKVRELYRR